MSTTYSTAMANCFRTEDGGIGSSVAAVKPSTEGIASEALIKVFHQHQASLLQSICIIESDNK